MRIAESFRLGMQGLVGNKLRAALTMLGIVFGVASVIAMTSIGEGARRETLQTIELLGTNNIIINAVTPDESTKENKASSFSPGLTIKDALSIKDLNPLILSCVPLRIMVLDVAAGSMITEKQIIGTAPEYAEVFNARVVEGTFFQGYHNDSYSNVCVIGSGIKQSLFRFRNAVNERIKIGNQWFTILGVVSPKSIAPEGNSPAFRDFNQDIYIPFNTMTNKLETDEENAQPVRTNRRGQPRNNNNNDNSVKQIDKLSVTQITAKIKNGADIREAAALTERILNRRHYGIKDYSITLPEQLLEQKQKTQRIFNIVMGAIAGISLLVGGIGIMNIMLANILERTREIGIRRAVGATRFDILLQFMFEAVSISVIGGITGIFTGAGLTGMISTYAGWNTALSSGSVVLAFFVAVFTGIVFGIYPAKKAADKSPIESLRYE